MIRLIIILIFLILSAFIRLNDPLPERITRYRLRLTLFIFNNPSLIPPIIGYKSTLSIILGKLLFFSIKNRSYLFIYLFKFYVHMRPCGYDRRPITSLAVMRTLIINAATERQL